MPVARARARFRRRLTSWASSGEKPRSVSRPGLADRPHARIGRQGNDSGPARVVDRRRVVGMDADGRVEPRIAPDELDRGCARIRVPAGHEDPLDAGQPGATEDELDVARRSGPPGRGRASRSGASGPRRPRRAAAISRAGSGSGSTSSRGKSGSGLLQPAGLARVGAPAQLAEEGRAAVAVARVRIRVAELGEGSAARSPAGTARRRGR